MDRYQDDAQVQETACDALEFLVTNDATKLVLAGAGRCLIRAMDGAPSFAPLLLSGHVRFNFHWPTLLGVGPVSGRHVAV